MLSQEFAGKIEVTGIYAREHSVEHAIDLCMEHAPNGFVYTDYDRMLQEAEADYVYIANANHVHHEYALRAMQAGHNVLVEKPITVTRVEMSNSSTVLCSVASFVCQPSVCSIILSIASCRRSFHHWAPHA